MKSALGALLVLLSLFLHGQVTTDPCIENHDFKIVILGSSTAAGSGAYPSDSAWVNRYRIALKSINSNNEVVNLAVGGFTTYRIMPNAFVTPAGRPAVDTLNNITAALKLNPHAIIVNLPSNDRQWPMSEQLNNFDSLYNHAWNNGVPLFVCTTQPIEPVNWALYQRAVRDSIMNTYGPYAIDFFSALADTNDAIQAQYAADAVHLNNSGHAILFQHAWYADVLAKVFEPAPIPDLAVNEVILPQSQCADSTIQVGVVITNLGDTAQMGQLGWAKTNGPITDSVLVQLNGQLLPCAVDTIWTGLNAGVAGAYDFSFTITYPADTILDNNTANTVFETVVNPVIAFQSDTLCFGQNTQFNALLLQGDTLLWYASATDTVPITTGTGFAMVKDTALFAQAVTGPLHFKDQLFTTNQSNIKFNGNMFNLVAKRDLTLTSFRIRSEQTGQIPVNVYAKSGAYQGFEQNPNAWNLFLQDTLAVSASGDSILLDIVDTILPAGDTLALYVHMANSNHRLYYQSNSPTSYYETDELRFLAGSGMGFNFGTDYPNRVINARFNYHFGENLEGSCASSRVAVNRVVSPRLDLGMDTVGPMTGVWLSLPPGYSKPYWMELSSGDTISTMSSVLVDSTVLPSGMNWVEVICEATNAFGCITQDTIQVTLTSSFHLAEHQVNRVKLYPNPAGSILMISSSSAIQQVKIMDLSGQIVQFSYAKGQLVVEQPVYDLPAGVYLVRIKTEHNYFIRKFVKR